MPQTLADFQICNLALSSIGKRGISALTDTISEEAVRCNEVFASCKAAVLREHDWRFANVTVALVAAQIIAPATTAFSALGWAYTYGYPSGCDFVRKVFIDAESSNPEGVSYEIVQDPATNLMYIACDYDDAYVKYTRGSAAASTVYDALFLEALVAAIATKIAFPLTRDRAVEADAIVKYERALSKARLSDRQEDKRPIPKTTTSSFEDAR
jgi:hypothetical protein